MHQRLVCGSGMVVSGLDGLFCRVTVLLSGVTNCIDFKLIDRHLQMTILFPEQSV